MNTSFNDNFGKLILRFFLGFFLLFHGYDKFKNGLSFIENILIKNDLPSFLSYGIYISEILAPILLILGFKTRSASFIILLNILFVIYLVHLNDILEISKSGALILEVEYFYILASLSVIFLGPGNYSLDRAKK